MSDGDFADTMAFRLRVLLCCRLQAKT